MTTKVQDILNAARALPPRDQLDVLQCLAKSLSQQLSPLTDASMAFWKTPSLDDLALECHAAPIDALRALSMPDWPRDETADDLIDFVREQRHADRAV